MDKEEQVRALFGGAGSHGQQEEDWKSKFEEAQRQLNSARVEEGRVRKLNEEKKALEKRIAELEKGRQAADLVAGLSEDERGDVPDEYVGVAARVASDASERVSARVTEELERLRKEREEEREEAQKRLSRQFLSQVEAKFPKFLADIGAGGDKKRAWDAFMENNSESVLKAFNSCNLEGLVYHVNRFYRDELGVRPPEGEGAGASAPDPITSQGGNLNVNADDPNKKWTKDEYDALEKKALSLRASGNFKEYRRIVQELDNILAEGRLA